MSLKNTETLHFARSAQSTNPSNVIDTSPLPSAELVRDGWLGELIGREQGRFINADDKEEAEAVATRTSFRPGVLGLGNAGEEINFARGEKERFSLEGRGTGFCIRQ
eukprot:gene29862-39027_t